MLFRSGLKLKSVELRNPPYDYEAALAAAAPGPGDALLCTFTPFSNSQQTDALAIRHRLPSMCGGLNVGGLIGYAPSLPGMFRTAAELVDKLRKGAKPADLPVEQPTRFTLTVNLKMANALGLTIPQAILARADEVIE